MRIIGLSHTYYTLMVLMQLRMTVFEHDSFDLILTDESKNSELVYSRLCKSGVFDNCYFLNSEKCYIKRKAKVIQKFKRVIQNVRDPEEAVRSSGLEIKDYSYDIMLGYVIDRHDEQVIFQLIKKCNTYAIYQTYEESFVSYCSINGIFSSNGFIRSDKWLSLMMHLFGKSKWLLSNNLEIEWFFDKDIVQYSPVATFKNIPKFDVNNVNFKRLINGIFNITEDDSLDRKYVFLEDSSYLSGKETDDLQILDFIAGIVGKENIIVKLHPRTTNNRFEKNGYYFMKNNIPLEALMFNQGKTSEIVFMTMSSSAPLTCIVDFNANYKVIMLYMCSKFPLNVVKDKNFMGYINSVQNKYGVSSFAIPENKDELKKIITMY